MKPLVAAMLPRDVENWSAATRHFRTWVGEKGSKRLLTSIRDDVGAHFGKKISKWVIRNLAPDDTGSIIGYETPDGRRIELQYAAALVAAAFGKQKNGREFVAWFAEVFEAIVEGYRHAGKWFMCWF